ncbi:MAG: alanine racemase, partial [Candidatus Zixiibacteriota bacterium]
MKKENLLQWLELSERALSKNLKSLIQFAGKRIIAVSVKANAYGHGLGEITAVLNRNKRIEYITVHSLEEAVEARRAGWKRQIMVLGPIAGSQLKEVFIRNLEPTIFELSTLRTLGQLSNKFKRQVRTHLKLETGTNRQGLSEQELAKFAKVFKSYPFLKKPYGASTHFANIEDTTNHEYAEFQLANFNRLIKKLETLKIRPEIRHTASSAATILFDKTRFEMVRPGIAVYGHWPSKETFLSHQQSGGKNNHFQPVLCWKTRITQLKDVKTDEFIGYGCTYRTTKPTKLAILPIGYYDGYSRALSNTAYVLIRGRRAPVRGRVCMNLTMVDVTDIKGVKLGDEVTLIGSAKGDAVTAEQ